MFYFTIEEKIVYIVICLFFKVLLPASNLLQLQEVKNACCDFLQAQLCPTNVIGIIELADLHSCTKLLTSSELYIQHHFSYEMSFITMFL